MYFYPQTLRREWYTSDVCDSIYASLEGTKNWTKYYFGNEPERNAYLDSFARCQELVKQNHLKPTEMLKALSQYHDEILEWPKPPFFSIARWFYDPVQARDHAVRTAFNIVDGVSSRYLP